jgi:peptide/nickel transport system ATP-binding protein
MRVLTVDNIAIDFATDDGQIRVIDQLSFKLNKGEILGIVGESGCGKSVTAMSLLKLLPQPAAKYQSGTVRYNDTDLWSLPLEQMKQYRGKKNRHDLSGANDGTEPGIYHWQTISRDLSAAFPR